MRCGVHSRSKPSGSPASWPAAGGRAFSSGIRPLSHRRDDPRDGLLDGHTVVLRAVAIAERDRAGLGVLATGDEDEGNLLRARIADLLAEAVVREVDLGPDAFGVQAPHDVLQVLVERVGHRDGENLNGSEPRGERPGVVLDEDREEALDRAEQRAMDHHGALARAIGRGVLELEELWLEEVELDRRELPRAPDRVLGLDGDLGTVEGGATWIVDELEARGRRDLAQSLGRGLPRRVVADGLLWVAGRELEVELLEPVVAQKVQHEGEQGRELVAHLVEG